MVRARRRNEPRAGAGELGAGAAVPARRRRRAGQAPRGCALLQCRGARLRARPIRTRAAAGRAGRRSVGCALAAASGRAGPPAGIDPPAGVRAGCERRGRVEARGVPREPARLSGSER